MTMEKIITQLPEIKLVGISTRTNNEAEENIFTMKIFRTLRQYFNEGLQEKIMHRVKPGTTYCAYTKYRTDFITGRYNYRSEYTYFVGEEVSSFDDLPEGFTTLTIPAQNYVKFTNGPGGMPEVRAELWEKVWKMSPQELGGQRAFLTDFETYEEPFRDYQIRIFQYRDFRRSDHQNIVLDLYLGI